ncbi:MAG: hypothetical protein ABJP79_17000 [Tateyamaria sp.]|uniref:hypothetical protein n=1 Tax=Tateyamaria sp. TaxID=1929288 RepID=UPI00329CAE22
MGDIRGMGLMTGVEFVASREHKTSLAAPGDIAAQFKAIGLKREMLLYPGAGTIDGQLGNHVMFAPAFVSTDADISDISDISDIAGRFAEIVAMVFSR